MGLDIVAYNKLAFLGHHGTDPGDPEAHESHIEAYSYGTFAAHALAGLPLPRPLESAYDTDLVRAGCFTVTEQTQILRFRAGSYGGYGLWREHLASRFNPYRAWVADMAPDPELPFYELIWFADNEGTLCERAARSLLKDFTEHEQAYADALLNDYNGPYYLDKYRSFMQACELAADGGLIKFC